MWYYVYRETYHGFQQEVGRTRHESDAILLYDRWHSAFICYGGKVIKQKNMITIPWNFRT